MDLENAQGNFQIKRSCERSYVTSSEWQRITFNRILFDGSFGKKAQYDSNKDIMNEDDECVDMASNDDEEVHSAVSFEDEYD